MNSSLFQVRFTRVSHYTVVNECSGNLSGDERLNEILGAAGSGHRVSQGGLGEPDETGDTLWARWLYDQTYATNRNGSRSRPIIRSVIFGPVLSQPSNSINFVV